jgi:hypothetical protein
MHREEEALGVFNQFNNQALRRCLSTQKRRTRSAADPAAVASGDPPSHERAALVLPAPGQLSFCYE